jgi:glycosyltransferase involved in cell wall biosynthesis
VALEALASGLPVAALRAGGIGDIVQPGVTGLLCAPEATAEEFAHAIETLVDDAGLRLQTAESARAYALTQSWDAIMESLRERYLQVIAHAPAEAAIS